MKYIYLIRAIFQLLQLKCFRFCYIFLFKHSRNANTCIETCVCMYDSQHPLIRCPIIQTFPNSKGFFIPILLIPSFLKSIRYFQTNFSVPWEFELTNVNCVYILLNRTLTGPSYLVKEYLNKIVWYCVVICACCI